jgi:uncharacterized protein (DUF362 family)
MSKTLSKVIIRGVDGKSLLSRVQECMEFCEWQKWVQPGALVAVKPNLCTAVREKCQMANTDPALVEAVCQVLRTRTKRVVLVEADGLRQTAWEAFEASGYHRFTQELDLEFVNLSESPTVKTSLPPAGNIDLPEILLRADAFITLPVLKTHALTYFTGALKNQWGCLPQYDRILLHKYLDPMLVSLHSILQPRMALMDGIIGMEGRGPTNGTPRRLDVVLASQDSVALDVMAMRLVGLEPGRARHVVLTGEADLGQSQPAYIQVDGEWTRYQTQFEPAVLDKAIAAMNYMSRYRWFVKYALEQNHVFYPVRSAVLFLRRFGLIEGG